MRLLILRCWYAMLSYVISCMNTNTKLETIYTADKSGWFNITTAAMSAIMLFLWHANYYLVSPRVLYDTDITQRTLAVSYYEVSQLPAVMFRVVTTEIKHRFAVLNSWVFLARLCSSLIVQLFRFRSWQNNYSACWLWKFYSSIIMANVLHFIQHFRLQLCNFVATHFMFFAYFVITLICQLIRQSGIFRNPHCRAPKTSVRHGFERNYHFSCLLLFVSCLQQWGLIP